MKYIVAWAPFVINLFMIHDTYIVGILLIVPSLILGAVILGCWNSKEMESMDKKSKEYKKLKSERDTAFGAAIGGVFYGLHETKKTIKDVSDPDNWKTDL